MSDDRDQSGKDEASTKEETDAASSLGKLTSGAGDVLSGASGLLDPGVETEEAREALETASKVADTASKAAQAASDLGKAASAIDGGNVGKAAAGLGDALGGAGDGAGGLTGAIGGMVPDTEARQALQDASRIADSAAQIARGAGQLVDGASELLDELIGGGRHPVEFELEIAGEDTQLTVRHVSMQEGLGELYDGWVEATFSSDAALDEEQLLSKDVTLTIMRGDERRYFRGIIRQATIRRAQEHQVIQIDVAPALWLADETLDSRIYQDITVPDLVEKVVKELLGGRNRKVKRELVESYKPHEYLVQHRESHYQFLSRLMREEGIFFYFDHDEDDSEHEVLVLADSNNNRPLVRPSHDGIVEYEEEENRREGREVAFSVHREQRVGASDAVVRGFDWTNPALKVEHELK